MKECRWTYKIVSTSISTEFHEKYDTECGNVHRLIESDNEENGYLFCPFCGGRIRKDGE